MQSAKKILIIGGGIGGTATALALHRKGFQHQDQRFPRAKMIVEQSLRSAKLGQLDNFLTVALRESLMKLIQPVIKDNFKSLHAYRA